MKCSKCGKELNEEQKFCDNCGQKVEEVKEKTEKEKEEIKEEKEVIVEQVKQEKKIVSFMENDQFFCTLSLILYFGSGIIETLIAALAESIPSMRSLMALVGLCPLAAYALCIYARIKYPNSKFAKILLIVYIVLFVLGILALVLILVLCAAFFREALQGCE